MVEEVLEVTGTGDGTVTEIVADEIIVERRGLTMKVLLRSDIDGVGKRGDIIDVSGGFARNHLLPAGKAIVASAGAGGPGRGHATVAGSA